MKIQLKQQLHETESDHIDFVQPRFDDRSPSEKEAQADKTKAETRALNWHTTKDQVLCKLKYGSYGFLVGITVAIIIYLKFIYQN